LADFNGVETADRKVPEEPLKLLSPLGKLPLGIPARLAEIRGGQQLTRRLLGLGLRVGSRVTVLHHRGRGVVLSNGDTRVALGGGIVEKLWVEPFTEAAEPDRP
jgi:ferrous iron transport protein A